MEEIRQTLPLTNQKLWEMAKVITQKQILAMGTLKDKIDVNILEELWFDWLEEQIFGEETK